jgi:hypothetical protein
MSMTDDQTEAGRFRVLEPQPSRDDAPLIVNRP